jgi:hypothetical protein
MAALLMIWTHSVTVTVTVTVTDCGEYTLQLPTCQGNCEFLNKTDTLSPSPRLLVHFSNLIREIPATLSTPPLDPAHGANRMGWFRPRIETNRDPCAGSQASHGREFDLQSLCRRSADSLFHSWERETDTPLPSLYDFRAGFTPARRSGPEIAPPRCRRSTQERARAVVEIPQGAGRLNLVEVHTVA